MATTDVDQPRARRRGDEQLLAALAAGHTYAEAAKIAGLGRRRYQAAEAVICQFGSGSDGGVTWLG
jgi:hypothetical protein